MGVHEDMRLECGRLHESHTQRIKSLEEYQKVQNGNLGRMAKALEEFRNRLTWILVLMVGVVSIAIPEMIVRILGFMK